MYMQLVGYLMWKKLHNSFRKVMITQDGDFLMYEKVAESCWLLILELKLVVWGLTLWLLLWYFLSSVHFLGSLLNVLCSEVCLRLFENAHCSMQTLESQEMVWAPKMIQVLNARKKHLCSRHASNSHVLKLRFVSSHVSIVKYCIAQANRWLYNNEDPELNSGSSEDMWEHTCFVIIFFDLNYSQKPKCLKINFRTNVIWFTK